MASLQCVRAFKSHKKLKLNWKKKIKRKVQSIHKPQSKYTHKHLGSRCCCCYYSLVYSTIEPNKRPKKPNPIIHFLLPPPMSHPHLHTFQTLHNTQKHVIIQLNMPIRCKFYYLLFISKKNRKMIIIARDFRYVVNVSKINTVFERKKNSKNSKQIAWFSEIFRWVCFITRIRL